MRRRPATVVAEAELVADVAIETALARPLGLISGPVTLVLDGPPSIVGLVGDRSAYRMTGVWRHGRTGGDATVDLVPMGGRRTVIDVRLARRVRWTGGRAQRDTERVFEMAHRLREQLELEHADVLFLPVANGPLPCRAASGPSSPPSEVPRASSRHRRARGRRRGLHPGHARGDHLPRGPRRAGGGL